MKNEAKVYATGPMTQTLRAMLRSFGARASAWHMTEGRHVVCDDRPALTKFLEGQGCEVTKGSNPGKIIVRLQPLERKEVTVGTCRFCGGRYSVEKGGRLADHGFKISDGGGRYYGYRAGSCPGQRKAGWEKSTETGLILKSAIEAVIRSTEEAIENVKSGAVKVQGRFLRSEIVNGRRQSVYEELGPGDKCYESYRDSRLESLGYELRSYQRDLERLNEDLANWKEAEYPKESRTK